MIEMTPEDVARLFHETYERLAPDFHYETRKASAVPWEDVPEPNQSLMIAVAGEVLGYLNTSIVTEDTMSLAHQVLHCPMQKNDANAATVGEFLGLLLSTLWIENEGFSGKRPFGNSDWQYDVYIALSKAGLITGLILDEDGYVEEFSQKDAIKADELVLAAIRLAYDHG